jgi:tetratricopeptide repeat protein
MVAQRRGDYDQALEWYRKSLAIKEELGNRAGMANSYHQLGILLLELMEVVVSSAR